ncbi:MAG: 1,4-alpha-glucan branching protein GlgB [Clostridia bacterium]|nr:1,4-alpha-glucan branching protein GlgB [Clostridia bacterium]
MISDYDLYLICEGTHRNLDEVLGARPVSNSQGLIEGYYFALWAPHAKSVSVVGDFNGWLAGSDPMTRVGDSPVWETYIEGVPSGAAYKYCLVTEENDVLYKADPMGRFAEVRPHTASRTYFDAYRWNDLPWRIRHNANPGKNEPLSIYELHLGSWRRGKDNRLLSYRETADLLVEYFAENRYTHVEMMPVAEHPFDGSWGYQITGFYAPTSRYGTPEDFKYLVDRLHQAGVGVILDWVPGHFPKDEQGLRLFDGTPLFEGDHQENEWGTLKFDFSSPFVKQFLIANALYWLKEFHIDGLRVDAVSSMLYLDYGRAPGEWKPNRYGGREDLDAAEFFRTLSRCVQERFPGALLIAEESGDYPNLTNPVADGGLGFTYKWDMGFMNDTLRYMQTDPLFRSGVHHLMTFSMLYAFREHYILPISHDECVHGKKNLLDKMSGAYEDKFASEKAYLGYMFAHSGKKLLFMGCEFGQFMEWRYYESLEWKLLAYETHRGLYAFTRTLLSLYRDHPAFWEKDDSWEGFYWCNADDAASSVYSFLRRGEKEEILVLLNMTPVGRDDYWITVPEEGVYTLLLNSDEKQFAGRGAAVRETLVTDSETAEFPNRLRVDLPPLSVLFYQKTEEKKPCTV